MRKMELKLVESNSEEIKALEEFLCRKENKNTNEATFFELAKTTNFSFSVEECSRLLSHHICESLDSYTQQSQRYVKMGANAFVVPQEITEMGAAEENEFRELNMELFEFYNRMTKIKEGFAGRRATEADYVHGIKIEDGRYVLPLSTTTNVFTTMNFSRIINFYKTMNRIPNKESAKLLDNLGAAIAAEVGKRKEESAIVALAEKIAKKETAKEKKIAKLNAEKFEKISEENPVVLLNAFQKPIIRTGLGALTSTNEKTPSEIIQGWKKENAENEKAKGVTERVTGYGHTSVIEHARATFGLEMSLTCYHQFERHRLPSNVRERFEAIPIKRKAIIPESVRKNPEILKEFNEKVKKAKEYRKKIAKKSREAQAYMLLNCDRVKVISSTNARMDKEIMSERLCNNAQWEIRHLYEKKLEELKKLAPVMYDKIGPGCIRGACPEGALTCGKIVEVRKKYNVTL